jgi:hypothetical protein
MDHRDGEFQQIYLISRENILLARSRGDSDRRDRMLSPFKIGFGDLFDAAVGGKVQSYRQAGVTMAPALRHRRAKEAKPLRVIFNLFEQDRGAVGLANPANDGSRFKVPINLDSYTLELSGFFKSREPFS